MIVWFIRLYYTSGTYMGTLAGEGFVEGLQACSSRCLCWGMDESKRFQDHYSEPPNPFICITAPFSLFFVERQQRSLSQYINYFIKAFAPALPSYIQDTTHVLTRIYEIKNIGDTLMVTMDVTSLYSNIKQRKGLGAVNHFLQPKQMTIHIFIEWT